MNPIILKLILKKVKEAHEILAQNSIMESEDWELFMSVEISKRIIEAELLIEEFIKKKNKNA